VGTVTVPVLFESGSRRARRAVRRPVGAPSCTAKAPPARGVAPVARWGVRSMSTRA